jgi:hypothetical protein
MPVVRNGIAMHDRTTIDYALVEIPCTDMVEKMLILEESDLSPHYSDHRPVLLSLRWSTKLSTATAVKPSPKQQYKIHGRSQHLLHSFEDRLEPDLAQMPTATESIHEQWKNLKDIFHKAAVAHFGTKLVDPTAKSWINTDTSAMLHIRRFARLVVKAA